MRANDAPELQRRLSQLADALAGKAPSAAGLVVWLDALAECDASDVWAVLVDWPKSHAKMPLPAEVLKIARDLASARRERIAEGERKAADVAAKRMAKTIDGASWPGGKSNAWKAAQQAIAEIRKRPKPTGKAWAFALRDRENAGELLYPVQRENWRAALREMARTAVETEDEREARLEREAIQAEAGA
jgi:hypothetical protein